MSFEHIAFRLMQPRDHDQLVTDFDFKQRLGESRFDLACRAVASAKEEARRPARLPVLPRRACLAVAVGKAGLPGPSLSSE
jgi:hypothetical protein